MLRSDHERSALHLVGIYFFAKGFLLTRLILDSRSDCDVLPLDSIFARNSSLHHDQGCWHPKTFDKAVVIIIDALRYDFTVPFEASIDTTSPRFFHNALPILHETARNSPDHAFLLPFIADPPTTTLQRLKGLTTGSLPTFIDAGSNFAGTAIEEDNLLSQLRLAGKTLVHLGDDTWHSLFPGFFDPNLTHAYDSFNVWDLHTVDNGVIQNLIPLLTPPSTARWDVIFGHFLGVDHAGHRYGPDHPAMREKLKQMDEVIQGLMDLLDPGTLLVVMGDHGMDTKGDHGGESDEEVEAALWMYSKKPVFGRTHPSLVEPPRSAKDRPVRQIDLVPTLSLLLGVPIPFNNLGAPIEEAFAGVGGSDWKNLARVNSLTSDQIRRYQIEYSQARNLEMSSRQQELQIEIQTIRKDTKTYPWKDLYRVARDYQKETLQVYRGLWASFDIPDMIHGIEILAGSLVFLLLYSRGLNGIKTDMAPLFLRNIGLGTASGAPIGAFASKFVGPFSTASGTLYAMGIGGLLASLFSFYRVRAQLVSPFPKSLWGWLSFAFTVSQAIGFASNSYTIHEDSILLFFLTTFGVISCISSLRQSSAPDRVLGTYHSLLFTTLTRAASLSRLCREEQMPHCRSTFYATSTSSTSAPWQLFIPYAVAIILPEIIKAFFRGTASYEGSAGFWIGFLFRIGLLLVATYWTIDASNDAGWFAETVSETVLKTTSMNIARCVLAIALAAGIATFIFAKPCVSISVTSNQAPSGEVVAIPTQDKPQVHILGYANVYGTRYFLLLPTFVLITAVLLPPMGQFSLAICCWQVLCLVEILDTNGLIISMNPGPAIGPIILGLLGSYHFFKTGHQAVLSSIQWNAAFIPLRTIQYPWSPLLVIFNSFGAQILCAIAVPLTVLWKRPISKLGLRGLMGSVMQATLTHMLYYATTQLATTMWAGHLRRHLMLYRVFMPRFLMGGLVLVVIDLTLVSIALMGVRVSSLSVGEVFGY